MSVLLDTVCAVFLILDEVLFFYSLNYLFVLISMIYTFYSEVDNYTQMVKIWHLKHFNHNQMIKIQTNKSPFNHY